MKKFPTSQFLQLCGCGILHTVCNQLPDQIAAVANAGGASTIMAAVEQFPDDFRMQQGLVNLDKGFDGKDQKRMKTHQYQRYMEEQGPDAIHGPKTEGDGNVVVG